MGSPTAPAQNPPMSQATLGRDALKDLVLRFNDAFNRDDLDAVMTFFAEDAVYETMEGHHARGKAAIRAAFEPQFRGDFGRLRFLEEDVLIDEAAGKVVLRWVCQHGLDGPLASGLVGLRQRFYRAVYGRTFGWEGLDVLHVVDGKLVEKRTYARAKLPLIRRAR